MPAAPPFGTLPPTSAALAPPAAVASTLVPTQSPGVPLLYEMPLGTRQALPPLKLSMHVYSPDPARRVVIIDGARLLEGEIVSGELKVSQITSEGVVLQLGDQVFLLPRGGR
ncbi:MAG: general secretion pathway protein GspB [Xanthomonadales bacterium]|nr:general secretion pathway protein GspB [Xanthomonadales bacterium]MBP7417351.1 general secretion pathway protein GspB [Xanthomonadales bacterium]